MLGFATASPAGAAPNTTVTTGTQTATDGGAIVVPGGTALSVAIDSTGGYDGALAVSFTSCGNADAAGTPVSEPICFDATDLATATTITDGAMTSGLALAFPTSLPAPPAPVNFTYTLATTGMKGSTGSCIADGLIPCNIAFVGVDALSADATILFQESIQWCLPGGTDGDGDGIPQACDPDDPPPPEPPTSAVFFSDRACAVNPPNPPSGYSDVVAAHWFAAAVAWAKAHGITFGIGDNLFGPERATTRLEFVVMLHRMGCTPPPGAGSPFTDTANAAARWAGNVGVVNGVSPGIFGGDQTITRAELFVMLWRAAGSPAPTGPSTFSDAQGLWFSTAVAWAQQVGLTNGVGGGLFGPELDAGRAMVVTALLRYRAVLPPTPAPEPT